MSVKIPGCKPPNSGGKRGKIKGFSAASRRRLLQFVNSLDRGRLPVELLVFVTLTYPFHFPDPRTSKRHLRAMLDRFRQHYGPRGLIWKMEPQKRGAAHFHLLLLRQRQDDVGDLLQWWAHNWHDIAGSTSGTADPNHLKWHLGLLGNKPCVEQVRDWEGVGRYACKYLAKVCVPVEGWDYPGRWWAVNNPELWPIEIKREAVPMAVAVQIRRQVVRYYQHQPTGVVMIRPFRTLADGSRALSPTVLRQRMPLSEAVPMVERMRAAGVEARLYKRRWRSSRGGCTIFMPAAMCERVIHWACGLVGHPVPQLGMAGIPRG